MQKKQEGVITVGLFGTCGGSTWRDKIMNDLSLMSMNFFNPQVDDWKDEYADIEAEHLVDDEIILFPVTDETYGTGSLAETGYSITQAMKSTTSRFIVIYIAPKVNEELTTNNPGAAKESNRSRSLVRAHLKKVVQTCPNIIVTEDMDSLLNITISLYKALQNVQAARNAASNK